MRPPGRAAVLAASLALLAACGDPAPAPATLPAPSAPGPGSPREPGNSPGTPRAPPVVDWNPQDLLPAPGELVAAPGSGTSRLAGVIEDPDGRPLEGATVELWAAPKHEFAGPPIHHAAATTGADGSFSVGPGPSPWETEGFLTASAPGMAATSVVSASRSAPGEPTADEDEPVRLRLRPGIPVSGRVEAGDGGPPDAPVLLWATGEAFSLVLSSDARGAFSFLAPAVPISLQVVDGPHPAARVPISVAAPGVSDVRLVVERGRDVQGRIVDNVSGNPVPGAYLRGYWGETRVIAAAPDGTFTLPRYWYRAFQVRAPGYAIRIHTLPRRAAGSESIPETVRLMPGLVARGVATDLDGRPAAGVRLRCFAHDAGRNWMDIAGPVTGADGGFTFVGLPFPGEERELRVFGTGTGYGVGCSVPLRGRPMTVVEGVSVRVPRLVEVEGMVRDETGAPAAGEVRVTWAIPIEQEAYRTQVPTEASTRSGADGKFRVTVPERAPVRAVAFSSAFLKGQAESFAPVHPDAKPATPIPPPKPLVLEVIRGASIRGLVRDRAGKPVERGDVRIEPDPPSDPRPSRDGDLGPGGEFAVGGFAPGRYDLSVVVHPEFLQEVVRGVEAGGPPVEVSLRRPGSLSGRVVAPEGTADSVPAEVSLTGLGDTRPLPRTAGGLAGGPERKFTFEKLSPGKYDLDIVCGDGRLRLSALEIGEERVELGDLRVEPAGSVGGVLTAGGKPAAGVPVEVFRVGPDGRLGESRSATTDAAGCWRVAGLAPGTHLAVSRPPGHRPVEVRFEAENGKERPIDLDASPGARVRVRVLDSAGAPAPGARVLFNSEAGSALFWEEGKPGTGPYETGPDGTLACCGLPAGDLQVTAQRPGGVAGTATVAAPAQGSVEVEVRLGKE